MSRWLHLLELVHAVARGVRPVADVPALEVGAGRQDDVGEPRLALHPDGLVDHERDLALAVGAHVAVGLGHRADERAAVAVVHLHVRVAGGRVVVLAELGLDGRAAEALAVPLEALVVHGLGDAQARDGLALGRVLRVGEGAALRPHAGGELLAGGGAGDVAGDAALGVAGEEERRVERHAARGGPDVAARLAHALHGRQGDHRPRPLVAAGGAAGAAPAAHAAGGEHRRLGGPTRGRARGSARAGTPHSVSAHSGVLGTLSLLPST